MAIENGQLANAEEVINAIASNFNDNAQLLFNADYIGFNSKLNTDGIPQLKNVVYDTFQTDSATTTTNMRYDATNDLYENDIDDADMSTLDEFNDSSVNTAIWDTVNSVSESATDLIVSTPFGTPISYATTKTDAFTTYGSALRVYVLGSTYNSGSGSSVTMKIQLSDGTNTVDVWSAGQSGSQTLVVNSTVDIYLVDSNTVKVRQGTGSFSNIDISSITGDVKLRLYQIASGSSYNYTGRFSWARYYDMDTTSTLIFETDSLSTVTNAVAVWNETTEGTNTITMSMSADGTNYETASKALIHRFTNTGTKMYVKFTITRSGNTEIDKITEYAVKYNFY